MKINLNVDVHHLTRVEGHGNIKVKIQDGEVKEAKWDIVETPRFFEAMLKGKHYSSAGILTARICGICSIGHCLASLRATENAFGITIPETARKLRWLAKHGETLQSHVLHLFFLAAPDFFNLPSAVNLLEKESQVYDLARRLKGLAGNMAEGAVSKRMLATTMSKTTHESMVRDEFESALYDLVEKTAPAMVGLPTVKPFVRQKPEVVNIARRLKGLANRICDVAAGRTTHPVSLQVGGVAVAPDKKALVALQEELKNTFDDITMTFELFKTFNIPDFVRETEFVSLKGVNEYPFIGGDLVSTDGVIKPESEYLAMTNEWVDANNTSKWCKVSRDSMAVGSLARFNNNHDLLHPEAKKVAEALGLKPVNHNPYMNNIAQLVEIVHVIYESIRYINELLDSDLTDIMSPVTPKAGQGVGAVEVPRGILYHDYEYDNAGRIVKANCIIPTTQNNLNIHLDMKELAKVFAKEGMTDAQLTLLCSMLVRAYDPCISCSVH